MTRIERYLLCCDNCSQTSSIITVFRALEISTYVLPVVTGLKNLFSSSWRGEEVRSKVSLQKVRKLVCELKLFFSVNNFTGCLSVVKSFS